MQCVACYKTFPISQFVQHMDEVMEEFLERLYSDRV